MSSKLFHFHFLKVISPCLQHTRYVRKVMRLIRENLFNWRYVYTHLIFFKITSLSISTLLPAVLPRVIARLEVLNWELFQSIHHGSLQVFNSPKMVSFQAGFEPGKQKRNRAGQVWAVGRLGQRCHSLFRQKLTSSDAWLGALSWWRTQVLAISGRTRATLVFSSLSTST